MAKPKKTEKESGLDVRRQDDAYRVVQDLNDAGLLRNPWTQWGAAQKIVKKALAKTNDCYLNMLR